MKLRKMLSLVLSLLLALSVLLPVGALADDQIVVGLITPETGDVAVYGLAVLNAVELYVKQFNEAGGVNGKPIVLIDYDDKGDPTEAMNAYNKLVYSDEIDALIGPVTSSPTFGVAEASVEDNVPGITPTATHPDVTTYGSNYFRACFEDPFQGGTMAAFGFSQLGAKTAAIIYNNADAYSTGLMQAFTATAEEVGLTIVATEAYGESDVDFKAQLTNIVGTNPDVLFIPDYYNKCYVICAQARDLGFTGTFLGVDGTDGVLGIEGADISVFEGMYFANHYSTESDSEVTQAFIADFEAAYGDTPNALAALAYDAAKILCNALIAVDNAGIEIAEADSYQAVIDALRDTDIEGVTGHITFDENNNPVKTLSIIQIVDGAYKFFGSY